MTQAWHFVGATLRDGEAVPPDGEWLTHTGDVQMCNSGLHASREPFDALQYAPGNVLCLVEVEDIVDEEKDKLVARRRKIIKRVDMTEHLRRYAREEALSVLHLWDAPEVVRRYLETGDESVREEALWEAAAREARAAARAARAARAAWEAARAARAARAAAREAAAAQRIRFNRMVQELFA